MNIRKNLHVFQFFCIKILFHEFLNCSLISSNIAPSLSLTVLLFLPAKSQSFLCLPRFGKHSSQRKWERELDRGKGRKSYTQDRLGETESKSIQFGHIDGT